MGHSQADKAQSRERILRKAADAVRDTGLESVSVGKLMRSVDLTHGGFYNHFTSRSDLLAQALERALVEGGKLATASIKLRHRSAGIGCGPGGRCIPCGHDGPHRCAHRRTVANAEQPR